MKSLILTVSAAIALAGAAQAAPTRAPLEPQASIPFVNHGAIRDWHVVDTRTLYVQDNRRQWYRATLDGGCFDLPFAMRIGFESARGVDRFDRFSTIRVGRDRCNVDSLTLSAAPPAKAKRG